MVSFDLGGLGKWWARVKVMLVWAYVWDWAFWGFIIGFISLGLLGNRLKSFKGKLCQMVKSRDLFCHSEIYFQGLNLANFDSSGTCIDTLSSNKIQTLSRLDF